MSENALTKAASGGLSNLINDNPYLDYTNEVGVMSGNYLRHSGNNGQWTKTGAVGVDLGTVFAFDMANIKHVWIGWHDGKPAGEHVTSVRKREPRRTRASLEQESPIPPKDGNGWFENMRVSVRPVDGGEQLDLTEKADNPYRPILKLLKQFGESAAMNIDPDTGEPKIPLVEIGTRSFTSDKFPGKKFAPTFKLVGWMSQRELMELSGEGDDNDGAPDADGVSGNAAGAPAATSAAVPGGGAAARPAGRRV